MRENIEKKISCKVIYVQINTKEQAVAIQNGLSFPVLIYAFHKVPTEGVLPKALSIKPQENH